MERKLKPIETRKQKCGMENVENNKSIIAEEPVVDKEENGKMKWVETEVDLSQHITKFVDDYVYELSKERMDMSRPLWDLHILNLKTHDAQALAVLRMHHALGDGASINSLLLACTRQTANPQLFPTTIPTRSPSANKTLKAPKNLLKLTINDVALGVTQAALSMYLNRRYGKRDIGSIEGQNNLPKNVRLRSCLFFNLRPAKGIQALADMMKKEKGESKWGWGNRFGYAILPLQIGMLNDPLDYVRQAKATADRKKYSYEPIFTYFLANFVIKFFGPKAAAILTNKIFSNASTCFSNVVGPREEIEFYGHPIAFIAPTCYGQPSALMVHFQSYVDKMAVIISVDDNVIPDPNQLLDDFEKSLHLIKDAAAATTSSPTTNL
nr:O-acyltransferase WSD1-like [Ipomoea batatas]